MAVLRFAVALYGHVRLPRKAMGMVCLWQRSSGIRAETLCGVQTASEKQGIFEEARLLTWHVSRRILCREDRQNWSIQSGCLYQQQIPWMIVEAIDWALWEGRVVLILNMIKKDSPTSQPHSTSRRDTSRQLYTQLFTMTVGIAGWINLEGVSNSSTSLAKTPLHLPSLVSLATRSLLHGERIWHWCFAWLQTAKSTQELSP